MTSYVLRSGITDCFVLNLCMKSGEKKPSVMPVQSQKALLEALAYRRRNTHRGNPCGGGNKQANDLKTFPVFCHHGCATWPTMMSIRAVSASVDFIIPGLTLFTLHHAS